jgi:serine/threonine protein kinase
MGEVWLGLVEGAAAFRRLVVLKFVAPDRRGDERIEQMLADEARVLGLLRHPGVVTAVDFLECEVGPLLVLDYVDGPSLRTALKLSRRRQAPLPEALGAWAGAEVARALDAAHRATDAEGRPLHLVHRDVSPDNVLISREGSVQLTDFGVARAAGNSEVTVPGAAPKGKRGYMAPEQAMGQPVGPPADVYALGRVVAEALEQQCGPSLRAVLEKAMAHDARDRYQSASELAAALIQACPPPVEPARALAEWLQRAAPEALTPRETSPGGAAPARPLSRSGVATPPPPPSVPLFASVADRSPRLRTRVIAAVGAALALGLPLAGIVNAGHASRLAMRVGLHAPTGELRVGSAPAGAEVYVDGTLRGLTPLVLQLSAGKHELRVGSPRLERWRAAAVVVEQDRRAQRDIDLTE